MKPPLNTLSDEIQRAAGLPNTLKCWEGGMLREGMETPQSALTSFIPCPMHVFRLAVPELYPL